MTMRDALVWLTGRLARVSEDLAGREAEEILERTLGCTRAELHLSPDRPLSEQEYLTLQNILEKRLGGTPLAYVLGRKYFHCLDIEVTPDVLIPRPDTEILVESVLKNQSGTNQRFVDLCTGSGAVAAALICQRPGWWAIASDISLPALRVAGRNLTAQTALVCSDLGGAFACRKPFDFITCNPPYISNAEMDGLDASVKDFEPHLALAAVDGLHFYRRLALETPNLLGVEGRIFLEIGAGQAKDVRSIFEKYGWSDITVCQDLARRDRVVFATRPHD